MKTIASIVAVRAVIAASALLTSHAAMAQPTQPPTSEKPSPHPSSGREAQPSTTVPGGGTARPTTSNRWESLPAMSAHRCVAEAIGTAANPETGAPVRATVDPQTGKPVCPPEQANTTKPPR
jgi:hypothetical protein